MVDGVKFNPFTQKAFTAEEIKKLDTNGDGTVSMEELEAGMNWISAAGGGADTDVELGSTPLSDSAAKIFANAKKNGVKDTANDQAELKQFFQTIKEEYLESYFKENTNLSAEEKTAFIALINKNSAELLKQITANNAKGPFNMQEILEQFEQTMDKAITDRKTLKTTVDNQISDYKNNTGRLDKLVNSAKTASADYLTTAEYNKILQDTVKYLMGELLNGNEDAELFNGLNSNYKTNKNYMAALEAIKALQNTTDPEEMKAAMDKAVEAITKFADTGEPGKIVETIANASKAAAEKDLEDSLNKLADLYIEKTIAANPNMTEEDIAELTKVVKGCVGTYVADMAEKYPELNTMDVSNLVNDFGSYIDSKRNALVQTKAAMNQMSGDMTNYYNNLMNAYDSANSDKYITGEEKANLVKIGADFVMSQLMNGLESSLLKGTKASYSNNKLYKEAAQLIKDMASETDPTKLNEMNEKAKALITQLLNELDDKALMDGIKSLKPMEVSDNTKVDAVLKSEISSDYQAGASRSSTSYGKQNEESLAEIQAMAKADLEKYATALKAQLKAELGAAYNEADVARYIADAMNDTIAEFSSNIPRRKRKGKSYAAGTDEATFVFERRSGSHKGRYVYNVKALIDTFTAKFNETSVKKNASKIDPSLATYDKENLIADSIGNDYYRNKTETIEGQNDDKAVYAELIEKAKTQLRSVAASMKASLIAEGVPLSVTEIDRIIDEGINETISDMQNAFQYCQPGGNIRGGGIAAAVGGTAAAGVAGGAVAGAVIGAASGYSALAGAGAGVVTTVGASAGSSALAGAAGICAAAGPIGWATAGVAAIAGTLLQFTNLFGATYGKHNADAGFFFERKSNSHSGRWGYDTKTLVDTFLAKIDEKVREAKEKQKTKTTTETA